MGIIGGILPFLSKTPVLKRLIRSTMSIFGLDLVNVVFLLFKEFEIDKEYGSGDIWDTAGPSQKYKQVGRNRNFKFVWEILSQKSPF